MLENRAESHTSGAPQKIARDHFIREKRPSNYKSILRSGKHASCIKQWRALDATPWCTIVSGQIDLNTGGARAKFCTQSDPDEKANPPQVTGLANLKSKRSTGK